MAGDLGIHESIVLEGSIPPGASNLPILHEYGKVRVALGASPVAPAPIPMKGLTENEQLGLSAFQLREADVYQSAKQKRPGRGASWAGGSGMESLDPNDRRRARSPTRSGGAEPMDSPGTPSEAPGYRLSGRIAVGTIMVSGATGALTLSRAEQTKIVAEVQNGLSWLAAQSPARDITFVHDTQFVSVNVQDNPGGGSYENCEKGWRDAALNSLGYSSGHQGIRDYVNNIKKNLRATFAYCALFTKYSVFHFAYADSSSTPYLVLNYFNDGWSVDNIDSVFAHETCHIFGAPDEYSLAGCNCGGRWGVYGVPNINCESCVDNGGVDCLMRANTFVMCRATPYHVGFKGLPAPGSAAAMV